VIPSSPYEAKGLLAQSIRDDDPVIFFEHKAMYDVTGEVPEESYTIPFGEANIVREGDDVTVVAIGRMVSVAAEAATELEGSGISIEIIDPRTVSPLDLDTILESVEKTGRLVVVDEASPRCNIATDISAQVSLRGVRRSESTSQDGQPAARSGSVRGSARGSLYPVGAGHHQRSEDRDRMEQVTSR